MGDILKLCGIQAIRPSSITIMAIIVITKKVPHKFPNFPYPVTLLLIIPSLGKSDTSAEVHAAFTICNIMCMSWYIHTMECYTVKIN